MAKVRILEFDIPWQLAHVVAGTTQYWQTVAALHPKIMDTEDLPDGKKMSVHVKASFGLPADTVFDIEMTRQGGGTHFYVEVCFVQGFSAKSSWLQAQGLFQDLCKYLRHPQLLEFTGETFEV